jgi:SAM-dependent MidA family methyltransferase
VWTDTGVAERGVVQTDAGFAFQDRPIASGELLARAAHLHPPPPYVSEIGLAAPALVGELARRLARGAMLFIDYGFGQREYYHPQRNRGTLMCHYRHRAHPDPFVCPGLQDITAHVDFSVLARSARAAGIGLLGYTTQAHFLINLGITDVLARTPPETPAAYVPLAAQAQRLLGPAEMGELFKVIAFGRDLPPLAGFAKGDLTRLL